MLTVRDSRRGRSKSPSGRERSRSRETRETVHKSSSKKYYDDSDSDDHRRKKSSSKRYSDESDSDHATRKKSSSKQHYDESDSDRGGRKKSSSKRHDESSDSDHGRHKKSSKKYYESDSEDGRKSRKKSSKKYSSDEDERSKKEKRSSHRRDHSPSSSDSDKHHHRSHHKDPYHAYPGQAPPYGYPQPGQYMPPPAGGPEYHQTRHMSYVDPKNQHVPWAENGQQVYNPAQRPHGAYAPTIHQQHHGQPQYAPPGSFPHHEDERLHTDVPDHQRTHSISQPGSYAQPQQFQYAVVDQNIKYKSKSAKEYTVSPEPVYKKSYRSSHDPQYVEVKPARSDRHDKHEIRSKYGSPPADRLSTHMGRLAVAGAGAGTLAVVTQGHGHDHHGKPPASPLLEAYHGTYQSISPMPSPLMIAGKDDSDLSDLELEQVDSDDERIVHGGKIMKVTSQDRHDSKHAKDRPKAPHRGSSASMTVISSTTTRKRVSFYDPAPDAKALAEALNHHNKVNTKPLVKILPHLSTDDILALRNEYKNHAKIGGKGINLSKHIKSKVTGHLGKAAYATALGRWESEAYWANVWYQGSAARRELLIEALIGRTNQEIWEIKNSFSDKRYSDDLEKCMKAELKADKFRTAILLALEERRMGESQPLEPDRVRRDVEDLHKALVSRDGGETAMINIIVVRSDAHLREVLRMYEGRYRENFARAMIEKSRNLVVSSSKSKAL